MSVPKLKLSLVMTSLLSGGGGSFVSTKTEVEFGHDKFAFWGGGANFRHDQTQLEFWYMTKDPPPPPRKQTCHDQTQLQFWF